MSPITANESIYLSVAPSIYNRIARVARKAERFSVKMLCRTCFGVVRRALAGFRSAARRSPQMSFVGVSLMVTLAPGMFVQKFVILDITVNERSSKIQRVSVRRTTGQCIEEEANCVGKNWHARSLFHQFYLHTLRLWVCRWNDFEVLSTEKMSCVGVRNRN